YAAMSAAAHFAWANRQLIGHWTRKAWHKVISRSTPLTTVYDVSHNIGKKENHSIDGKEVELLIHRKGATRAFGPHSKDIPSCYQETGQPVLIPGTMGTSSYILVGTAQNKDLTFGSCCHGAGRKMSRMQAKRTLPGHILKSQLKEKGIIIRCDSERGLVEEAPGAYKDVDNVIDVVASAGIARKVARTIPRAVIKGN
ncbi:MAG: RtcB family protein, partial [Candidatus Babeliales bacterium]